MVSGHGVKERNVKNTLQLAGLGLRPIRVAFFWANLNPVRLYSIYQILCPKRRIEFYSILVP